MPTKNPRINITLDEETFILLSKLAENKSVSKLAKELILEALELREDMELSELADLRDKQSIKRIKHDDVWK